MTRARRVTGFTISMLVLVTTAAACASMMRPPPEVKHATAAFLDSWGNGFWHRPYDVATGTTFASIGVPAGGRFTTFQDNNTPNHVAGSFTNNRIFYYTDPGSSGAALGSEICRLVATTTLTTVEGFTADQRVAFSTAFKSDNCGLGLVGVTVPGFLAFVTQPNFSERLIALVDNLDPTAAKVPAWAFLGGGSQPMAKCVAANHVSGLPYCPLWCKRGVDCDSYPDHN